VVMQGGGVQGGVGNVDVAGLKEVFSLGNSNFD
jgi:hypothetical protein